MSQDTPVAMFPKPDKTGPKPKKPLPRSRKRVERASRPARKKKAPKKKRGTPQARLGREADKLCGQIVRARGKCEEGTEGTPCKGPLQWAHGFSRRYRGTRWSLLNSWCLCSAHHLAYTHDPIRWTAKMKRDLGVPVYEELERLALRTTKDLDLPAIVASLKAELAAQQQYPAAA